MDTLPVTLIVKAPNQQFEDQTIKCEPTWSIRKLKGYLSEVYPCNPTLDEQKLIYSGQLLNDEHILKDVLRQYEGQDTHTVHLVYTPKNRPIQPPKTVKAPTKDEKTDRNVDSKANVTQSGNQNQRSAGSSSSDGLRHRGSTNGANSTTTPPFATGMPNPSQFFMPAMAYAQTNVNQNQTQYTPEQYALAQHMAVQNLMHQMYLQYIDRYNASIQQPNAMSPSTNYFPQTNLGMQQFGMNNLNSLNNGQQLPRPQQEAPAAGQPLRFQAPVDDDADSRDWLEILYTLSRLLVLLSLVYFYSSPGRCMIVILALALYYVYQNHQRTLRDRQQSEQVQEPAGEPDVIEDPVENAETQNVNDSVENEQRNEPQNNQSQDTTTTLTSTLASDGSDRLPTITLLRTFISSFFSSLIPETPAV